MENLDTQLGKVLSTEKTSLNRPSRQGRDPFADLRKNIPSTHSLKVWDFELSAFATTIPSSNTILKMARGGRVRILTIVPKKPNPLENIPFACAFCAPSDMKKFRKDIANSIVAGRLAKYLTLTEEEAKLNNGVTRNCGTIAQLDSLKGFPEAALFNVGWVPLWVYPDQFKDPSLANKVWMGPDTLVEAQGTSLEVTEAK